VKEAQRLDMKESVIASDLTIEGKIIGSGHVRIAGRFKGDVQVDGNVTLDTGAHLEGQVKASVVVVGGELLGNIENAKRVELLEGGVISGDVKAGSLTVAAGSRMRGRSNSAGMGTRRAPRHRQRDSVTHERSLSPGRPGQDAYVSAL
jgi:cytoskeletal protein CcmA (bactofilin family)